jgi:hypothetical protein
MTSSSAKKGNQLFISRVTEDCEIPNRKDKSLFSNPNFIFIMVKANSSLDVKALTFPNFFGVHLKFREVEVTVCAPFHSLIRSALGFM